MEQQFGNRKPGSVPWNRMPMDAGQVEGAQKRRYLARIRRNTESVEGQRFNLTKAYEVISLQGNLGIHLMVRTAGTCAGELYESQNRFGSSPPWNERERDFG